MSGNFHYQSYQSYSSTSRGGSNTEQQSYLVQDINGKRNGKMFYQNKTPTKSDRYTRDLNQNELDGFFSNKRDIDYHSAFIRQIEDKFNKFNNRLLDN